MGSIVCYSIDILTQVVQEEIGFIMYFAFKQAVFIPELLRKKNGTMNSIFIPPLY